MRQDSAQKKVWFIRTYLNENDEKLGYDFNISVGDTVELPAQDFDYESEARFILASITDVNIDGLGEMTGTRKFYALYHDSQSGMIINYIEGIIEDRSLFPVLNYQWGYDAFHQTYTWCMQHNEIYGYAQAGDNEPPENYCGFLIIDVDKIDVSTQINSYPNPADNYIRIEMPDNLNEVCSISIYDLTGKALKFKQFDSSSQVIVLDVADLDNGMYLLYVNMNEMRAVKKIIVNHR